MRLRRKKRNGRKERGHYKDYNGYNEQKKLRRALELAKRGGSMRMITKVTKIPNSTIHRVYDAYIGAGAPESTKDFVLNRASSRIVVLTEEEEESVKFYCLWQFDRGMPINMQQMKAIIRDINQRAIDSGERRAKINIENGPSPKYMKSYKRHPKLTKTGRDG